MADAPDIRGFNAAKHGLNIYYCRTQQRLAQRFAKLVVVFAKIGFFHVKHLAYKRIAVGVEAR